MFSIQKLLVLAAIILAVWYGYKIVAKLDQKRKAMEKRDRAASDRKRIDDLVACPVCGTYAARGEGRACDRDDCPYRA